MLRPGLSRGRMAIMAASRQPPLHDRSQAVTAARRAVFGRGQRAEESGRKLFVRMPQEAMGARRGGWGGSGRGGGVGQVRPLWQSRRCLSKEGGDGGGLTDRERDIKEGAEKAQQMLIEAVELIEQDKAGEAVEKFGAGEVAGVLDFMAEAHESQGEHERELEMYGKALELRRTMEAPADELQVPRTLMNVGNAQESLGDYGAALEAYEEALPAYLKALGEGDVTVAAIYNNMGLVYTMQGLMIQGLEKFDAALKIYVDQLGPEHVSVADTYNNKGEVYRRNNMLGEALELFEAALRIKVKALGPDDMSVATTCHNIAETFRMQGKTAESLEKYEECLKVHVKVLGEEHPMVATIQYNTAVLHHDLGRKEEAKRLFEKSAGTFAKVYGPDHGETRDALGQAARC